MRIVLLALAFAALASGPAQAGVSEHVVVSGGLVRTYRLYTPPGLDEARPVPVVLVFHGFGQSVPGAVRMSRFDGLARDQGFLAVYPYSVGPGWNAEGCCGGAARLDVDDVAFVDDLLADLRRTYRLDRRRTYATGISNGGIFAYHLACHRARTFAAVAPVAATMFEPCRPSARVSVIHVHGLEDRLVPFAGGNGVRDLDWPPVQDGIDFWRRRDGCPAPTVRVRGTATISTSRCAGGTAVRLITVADAGHQWPKQPVNTTAAIWSFFEAHPRPG
jgi:polyhydroxybutyrate depolymerase